MVRRHSSPRTARKRFIGTGAGRRTSPGTAPGTLVAHPQADTSIISVISYGPDDVEEMRAEDIDSALAMVKKRAVTWIDIDGLGDVFALQKIGERFGFHSLALEDVLNTHQRPKIEVHDNHVFIVMRTVSMGADGLTGEQISLFLTDGVVVSFKERTGDCLDGIRNRLRQSGAKIHSRGADYLAYAIMDAIVDGFFPLLEKVGEQVELLEDHILENAESVDMADIHGVRRDLLGLRRAVWPLRELVSTLIEDDVDLVTDDTRVFLRDCLDHALQVADLVETYRELGIGLVDIYMSAVSYRMNEVMKVLTIIATIFIPLTFLAGVYGMNFNTATSVYNMPELNWRYSYPVFWGIILLTAGGMVWWFWRRGWLGSRRGVRQNRKS